jgi:hypothetical protein
MTMVAVQYAETAVRLYRSIRRYCQEDETSQISHNFLNIYWCKYISFGGQSSSSNFDRGSSAEMLITTGRYEMEPVVSNSKERRLPGSIRKFPD